MKNLKYYMFLAATILFTGCSHDEEFIDDLVPGTQNKLVDIIIGTPQGNDSRVSYDDTTAPFAWENDDEIITVGFAEDGTYKGQSVFYMKDELTGDKKTATFTGALPEGAKQYKIYYKAANLTIATTDGSPKVDYSTQSIDVTSAETQTAHMKSFYQLATPTLSLENILDPATAKNLKLENSLLRLDVKSYPAAIGTLKNILFCTNVAKGTVQTINIGITNVPAEQKSFKAFVLFDPTEMAQTAGETFEVAFIGDQSAQAISKDNTKATFNKPGSRYNLVAYQDDVELQDVTTKAVLNNWTAWEGARVDASTHTITNKLVGSITPEMISAAIGTGNEHKLVIKKEINGVDIKAIREAAGCLYTGSENYELNNVLLQHLDLSGATIKASEEFYAKDECKTEDNKIGNWMFTYSGLRSVILPEGITEIGSLAFRSSKYLTSVNIPSTVTTLGDAAFMETALTSIEIPDNVTTVGSSVFSGCKKLETAKLSEKMTNISEQMFLETALTSIKIPASVTTINEGAFRESKLTSLVIPVTVTYVDKNLLGKMTTLRTLKFESADTKYNNEKPYHIFNGYKDSENCDLVIPRKWSYKVTETETGEHMFEGLAWKSINLFGDELTDVNIDAVNHTITTQSAGHIVPDMISVAIGTGNEHKLIVKGEINGGDIKAIREAAGCLYNCSKARESKLKNALLQHLDLSGATIKASEEFYAMDKCKTKDNMIGDWMFIYSGLRSVILPEGITEIGSFAFKDSEYLTSVNIPSTVTILKEQAFMKTALTSIEIPASVEEIHKGAFCESKLTSLVIPETVWYVDESLLGNMTTLRTLTFEGADIEYNTEESHHIFKGYTDSGNCDLVIPEEWKSRVSTSSEGKHMFEGLAWKSIKNIKTGEAF